MNHFIRESLPVLASVAVSLQLLALAALLATAIRYRMLRRTSGTKEASLLATAR